MYVYARLFLIEVEDPSFEQALVELAAEDPVAAKVVMELAELERDGAQAVSRPLWVFRLGQPGPVSTERQRSAVEWNLLPGADTLELELAWSSGEPLAWAGEVPLGEPLATRSVSPGWLLAFETSVAPDSETVGQWLQEEEARAKDVLAAHLPERAQGSPRARSRAVAALLGAP